MLNKVECGNAGGGENGGGGGGEGVFPTAIIFFSFSATEKIGAGAGGVDGGENGGGGGGRGADGILTSVTPVVVGRDER